MPQIILFQQ